MEDCRVTAEGAVVDLLIVEDHPLFRRGIEQALRVARPSWRLLFASDAAEAMSAVLNERLDVAVVDIGLPGDDGFALMRSIVESLPALPLILISARDDAATVVRAGASGARGFLSKAMDPDLIVGCIDQVLAGGTAFAVGTRAPVPVLTTRQAEILDLLAAGHGNKEIRYRLGIAERTVRAHLTDLFQLLGVGGRMQAVLRAREFGMIP